MKLNKIATVLAATAAVFGSVSAQADTKIGNFDITANVISTCFVETENIAFGDVQVTQATETVRNGNVHITCSKGVAYNVALSAGTSTVATARQMSLSTDAAERLNYSLSINDGSKEFNWGVAEAEKLVQTGAQNVGGKKTFALKATIPGSQFVTPGAYSDTLTATVSY